MARIAVQPERKLGDIHPHLYGHFIEHLGRCIYGGVFEPGSQLADEDGFRRDVLQAARELKVPILRWPGGNFSSGYHWLDGVGPDRPARPEMAWQAVEPNTFGTNEFIKYCRKLGCEPYICLNMGDGTFAEAVAWIEYCNVEGGTHYSELRRQHGFDQPHNVRYWGLGNEVWGDFQIGHKSAEDYAHIARNWAQHIKKYWPDLKLIACGGTGNGPSMQWDLTVLERTIDFVDYTALHYYWGPRDEDPYHTTLAGAYHFERYLQGVEGLIAALRRDRRMERPIYIAVDEWNVWGKHLHDASYLLRDALADSIFLHMLQRHCNTVKMANLAQMVNVLPLIRTRPDGMVREAIYWSLWLQANLAGPELVDCFVQCDATYQCSLLPGEELAYLDAVATRRPEERTVVLSVVNGHPEEAIEAEIFLHAQPRGEARAWELNGDSPDDANSFEEPDRVKPREKTVEVPGARFSYTFPAHSHTVIELPLA